MPCVVIDAEESFMADGKIMTFVLHVVRIIL